MTLSLPDAAEFAVNQNCYLVPVNAPLYRALQDAGSSTGRFYYIRLQDPLLRMQRENGAPKSSRAAYCRAIKGLLDAKPEIGRAPGLVLGVPPDCLDALVDVLEDSHPAQVLRTEQEFTRLLTMKTHAPVVREETIHHIDKRFA